MTTINVEVTHEKHLIGQFTYAMYDYALDQTDGNLSEASRLIGINVRTLREHLNNFYPSLLEKHTRTENTEKFIDVEDVRKRFITECETFKSIADSYNVHSNKVRKILVAELGEKEVQKRTATNRDYRHRGVSRHKEYFEGEIQ